MTTVSGGFGVQIKQEAAPREGILTVRPKVITQADYDKLPVGSEYEDAQGNIRRKQ